jgi:hypothetical protein
MSIGECRWVAEKGRTKVNLVVLALAGAALMGVPQDGVAQALPWGAGWSVGASSIGDLNADAELSGGGAATPIAPGTSWIAGIHVERWFGDDARLGVRVQTSYQQPRFAWNSSERKIDAFGGDVSLVFHPLAPDTDPPVLPYLAVGAGGILYDLGRGVQTLFPEADARHDGQTRAAPVVLVALGIDFEIPWTWYSQSVRIRTEVADHMAISSPLLRLSSSDKHGPVHHFRFTVGLHSAFSL